MDVRKLVESQRLLDVRLDPFAETGVFIRPLGEPKPQIVTGLGKGSTIIDPAQFDHAVGIDMLFREMIPCVTQEMDIASLPYGLGQNFGDRVTNAAMVVADHELHTMKPSFLELNEEVFPNGFALPGGEFYTEDLPATVPADAEGDQDGLILNDSVDTDLFIPGIEEHIRICVIQMTGCKALERVIQFLGNGTDGGGGELGPAEGFRDVSDLAGGDSFEVHFHQCIDQCLFASLVALEDLGLEVSFPVLRNAQNQRTDPRLHTTGIIAGPIAAPSFRPFIRSGFKIVFHLPIQDILDDFLNHFSQRLAVFGENPFDFFQIPCYILFGHGVFPFWVVLLLN